METTGVAPGGSAGKFQRLPDIEGRGEAGRFRRMSSSDGYEYDYSAREKATGMQLPSPVLAAPSAGGGAAKRKGLPPTTAGPAAVQELDMSEAAEVRMQSAGTVVPSGCPVACVSEDKAAAHGPTASSRGISFSEDTKPGPELGRAPSIQRKGTPGVSLMSDMADMAADYVSPAILRSGVSFSEDTKPGPGLGRAPSIQRKGTPGVSLMSDMADMAADMATLPSQPGVSFSEDTKAGPELGRAPSIQRRGTPGVSLMSDLADMAADCDSPAIHRSGVSFSEDTKPGPALGKAPSIQRKGTPGVALMSDMADMAAGMATPEDIRTGVSFSEDTKPGPRLGKAPSIQRKGTPGVSLMSDIADMASSYHDEQDRLAALFSDDMPPSSGVSFSEDTKPGPRLGQAPSIQRKGTPGVSLMSGLADMAADYDIPAIHRSGVSFSQDTKPGPELGRAPSIQRKGTPGVSLMSDMADMAADYVSPAIHRSGVSFSEDTKTGPGLGRAPSIQRKGTPGVSLMSDMADMAADMATLPSQPGVSFSEDTKAGPELGRAPSIQRRGTPGVSLMSDMADMAADIMEEDRPGVSFSEDTKPGPSFGRAPSIQRKCTPAAGLMSQAADVAEELCLATSSGHTQGTAVHNTGEAVSMETNEAKKPSRFPRSSTGSTFTPSEMPTDIMASVVPRSIRFSCDGVAETQPAIASPSVLGADLFSVAAEVSAICSKAQSPSPLHAPKPRRGSVSFDQDVNMISPVVSRSSSLQPKSTHGPGVLWAIPDMMATDGPASSTQPSGPEDTNMDGLTLAMAELGHIMENQAGAPPE